MINCNFGGILTKLANGIWYEFQRRWIC